MALRFMSESLIVGRQIIFEAVCVMLACLFFSEMVNMAKKQEEQCNRME